MDPIETFARAYLSTYASGDIDARLALFTEDATFEDPVGAPPKCGRQNLGPFWREIDYTQTVFTPELIECVSCGAEGVFRFRLRLETKGEPPIVFRVIETVELAPDGRAKRLRAYWNDQSAGLASDRALKT